MKNTRKKWIFSFLITALCLFVFSAFQLLMHVSVSVGDQLETEASKKAESIINTYKIATENDFHTLDEFDERCSTFTRLTADLLKETLSDSEEENIRACYNGYIISVRDGSVQVPPELKIDLSEFNPSDNDSDSFATFDDSKICFWHYARMKDNYYFLYPFTEDILDDFTNANMSGNAAFEGLETTYNLSFAIMREFPEDMTDDGMEYYPIYSSQDMTDPAFLQCKTQEDFLALEGTIDDENRMYRIIEIPEDEGLLIMRVPLSDSFSKVFEEYGISIACIFIFLTIFIVWIISVLEFVRDHHLTDEQKNRYHPAHIRKAAGSYGIISAAIIFAVVIFTNASSDLQKKTTECNQSVVTMIYRVMLAEDDQQSSQDYANELYFQYGNTIGNIMSDHPELINKNMLRVLASDMNVDFITMYDRAGQEIVSSTDLIGLQLGTSENDPTSQFRKILNGIRSIYASDVTDSYYGSLKNLIGIRTDEEDGTYGAMLIGVKTADEVASRRGDPDQIIKALTNSSDLALILEKESGVITNSTDSELTMHLAADVGIKENQIKPGVADFFLIKNQSYFGLSNEYGSNIYYYLDNCNDMLHSIMPITISASIGYLIMFIILYVYLLHGYTVEEFEKVADEGDYMLRRSRNTYTPERLRREYQSKQKKSIFDGLKWSEQFPDQKAKIVLQVFTALMIANVLIHFRRTGSLGGSTIFNYLIYGNWTRGFNMLAVSAIAIVGIMFVVIMMIIQMLFSILFNSMGTKGITIAHLILNLIRYAFAIVFLYLSCIYLGFDPRTVVVSAGIVTFAVSFGSKDIITDMLAGILIIFEGDFQVGDIIQVGDFRGTVMEIGVRSTKLIGNGNNIKSIPNQNVKNVLNLTRMNSWYTMEIKVPNDVPITDLENMLNKELPKIGRRIPEIINGPEYKGVINIGNGFMTILIIAEYDEDDYYKVQRKMNREMMLLFNEKNIKVL